VIPALKLCFGIVLGGFFLWLALRNVDLSALAIVTQDVNIAGLVLAALCLVLGYACRVQRWRMMLRAHNPALGFARPAVAFYAATAVNNLVPLRMGDALRCVGFTRWLGVSSGAVLGTMLVERLLDLIALLLGFALAVWLLAPTGAGWRKMGLLALGMAIVGAGALVLLPRLGVWATKAVDRFGPKVSLRLDSVLTPLRNALGDLSTRRRQVALVGWTLPVWLFEGATFWVVALAMPALRAPVAAWLALPAGTLATLLPTTPGHIGAFDYAAQTATLAFGNPLVEATAFVLVIHAVLWATTTSIGLVCLAVWALFPAAGGGR
jgi:glycosyltransferase 2 family protein